MSLMFLFLAISHFSATISYRQSSEGDLQSPSTFMYGLYLACLAVVQRWVGKPFCRDRASLSLCESIQIIKNVSLISGPLIIVFYRETARGQGTCRMDMMV